ncbi:MAG: winged helix-turn-helix transcriptional regulator [Kordiimonadaceae bacterium]|nr:winged helix-turn-helix transcriptional regulator [Kordiimonadaceae bacterium]
MNQRAFLARHLRNLSLEMMQEGQQICRSVDPDLDPSWGSILGYLGMNKTVTVMAAAKMMGISHVHAVKLFKGMKAASVVTAKRDPSDGRQTLYSLTEKGHRLRPLVGQITAAAEGVFADIEVETGDQLFQALVTFREALAKKGWSERMAEKLGQGKR